MADDLKGYLQSVADSDPVKDYLKEAYDAPEPKPSDKFSYGFKSMPSDVQNAAMWLEQHFPVRESDPNTDPWEQRRRAKWAETNPDKPYPFKSKTEKYGEDYYDVTPDERRKRMLQYQDAQLAEQFPDIHNTPYADSGATIAGRFVGGLTTPTAALPFGKGKLAASLIGGTTAAADVALHEAANEGEVDPEHVAIGAVGGAVLAPALMALGQKVGTTLAKRAVAKTTDEAEKLMDLMQDGINTERAKGVPGFEAIKNTQERLGVNMDQVNNAMQISNRRLLMNSAEDAAEALDDTVPIGGFIKPQGFVSQLLEPIASRIEKISRPTFGRLREHEYNIHKFTHEAIESVEPFFKKIDALPSDTQRVINKALMDGDFDIVERAFRKDAKALEHFKQVQEVLKNSFNEMQRVGYKNLTKIPNYFPRLIDDLDGLMSKLGKREQGLMQKALASATERAKRPLNQAETTDVVNKTLRGFKPKELPTRFSKERKIETLPEEFMDFYANPRRAMHTYLRETINDVEKRKFFGRHIKVKKGENIVDLDKTIGAFVQDSVKGDPIAQKELRNLLLARFYAGEQSPHRFVQTMKNLGYTATLGNPFSAVTQLGDLGISVYMNGWRNTILSMIGKDKVKAFDFGIIDAAKELSASPSKTARVLEKTLKASGFNRLDRFGKDTFLNGAYRKYSKLAKTEKGRKIIEGKYGDIFGGDTIKLLDDLKSGKLTDNVKLLLWNEISDVQPIALSEMPLKYLENPNGRIFYMLKTYTIKQLDIIRKDAFAEIKKGNMIKGIKNLTYFTSLFTAANMGTDTIKRWLSGQTVEARDVPDMVVNNLLKNFAATEWAANQTVQGKVGSVLEDYVMPPLSVIDSIGTDLSKAIRGKEFKSESLKYVPVFGKVLYMWQGNGMEKYLKARNKEDNSD